MRHFSRTSVSLSVALLSAIAACGSISDPKIQQVQSPLVGRWMLETHSDTFVFVTGPSSVDGYCSGPYCAHHRTTVAGAYLGGVLEVQDSLGLKGNVATSVQAAGTLTQAFCDSVDYNHYTGCTHVGAPVTASYIGEISERSDSSTVKSLDIAIKETIPGTTAGRVLYIPGATYAGDSIYGRFGWWGEPGHGPGYMGTFVMRRLR